MKKIICIILTLVMCFSLGGCYDSKEISRIVFVIAVGFDEGAYSFQIVKPSAFEGEGSEESPLLTTTVSAQNVYIAMDKLNSAISEKCDYSHIKMALFSEEKMKRGIENEITAMLKSNDFHPTTRVAMCKGKAADYLKNMEIPLDANPAEYYENIFKEGYTEYSPDIKLKDIQKNYSTQVIANVIPILDNQPAGMVITKDCRLTDIAEENEVVLYRILKEKDFESNYAADENTTVKIKKKNCKINVNISDNTPMISVKLKLDGNVIWSEKGVEKEQIEIHTKEKLESEITEFLYRTSMHYKADIFELYKIAKAYYLTTESWERENWQALFEKANYNVTVDINISREGININ